LILVFKYSVISLTFLSSSISLFFKKPIELGFINNDLFILLPLDSSIPLQFTKEKVGFSYKEQKEFKKLELDIKKIEIQKKEIQNNFIKDNLSAKEIENLSIELGLLEKELESKTQRWFELSEISQ
jgi:hypothetical protein